MMPFTALCLATFFALCGPRPSARVVRTRLAALRAARVLSPSPRGPARSGGKAVRQPLPPGALGAIASAGSVVVCVAAGGAWGGLAAAIVAPVLALVVRRAASEAPAAADPASRAALPLTCDLIAAGLRAGAAVPIAVASAAMTAPAGLQVELSRVAALLRLGTPPIEAWSALAHDRVLGPVAVIAARSADSGIRLADALSRSASVQRDAGLAASVARAERVGVLSLLPLGLCFLPAFVCLGVVPVVAGVAGDVFSRVGS